VQVPIEQCAPQTAEGIMHSDTLGFHSNRHTLNFHISFM
jgi:hypothetical protein